jgi:6-phosphogluconolactonase/glucosamine-6-phosphate isomerase/deaminase
MTIRVTHNPHPIVIGDIFTRIKMSDDQDKKQVLILGNPEPETYIPVAELINYHKVNCRNLYIFAMDEWADQDGNIAPESYKSGFAHSMLNYFVYQIDEKLRMPMDNVFYPTNKNIGDYTKMITDIGDGGADVCYSSPGWAGHIAFVDPSPEFLTEDMDEYLEQGARIVSLHPLTICQNSLHGVFGQSGDIANVPPKAATIGPADVANSRERIEVHALQTMGTFVSWQRMISRLILLGPVTPYVPSSIFQILETQVYVSEEIAAPFECWETVGY